MESRPGSPNRQSKFIRHAALIASDVAPVSRAKLAAIIVHKNNIVSIGTNSLKTHPLQKKFCRHPNAIHLHAEIDAISKALKRIDADDLKNSEIYIARVKYNKSMQEEYGLAKPCEGCQKALDFFGIKKIFYTEDATP